jgi:CubicO group peptidase (beta-lactamase class C family)
MQYPLLMNLFMKLAPALVALLSFHVASAQLKPTETKAATDLGFDASALSQFDQEIASGKYGNVDSLLILRHGKIALDHTYPHDYATIYGSEAKKTQALNAHDPGGPYNYFNPWWHPYYRGDGTLHSEQSVTKTVTSIVIGIAVTRGEFPSLDTPVLSFFDESKVANIDDRKRHLTLRNLLTMTVGMKWNDDVPYDDPTNATSLMEASPDWVQYFIDQPMAEQPGTSFYYNDGAPEALAYIFRKATGKDIEEYAAAHLFQPLAIDQWFWKRNPQGLADTEGGLYLDRHDLAKLLQLFQHDGLWNGNRIVSSDWVKQSITPAITVSPRSGVKYGYLWWLYPYEKVSSDKGDPRIAFGGSGFGGQLPVVLADEDIVIVVNAWNLLNGPQLGTRTVISKVRSALTEPKR